MPDEPKKDRPPDISPDVSVIIPVYNTASFLASTIRSLTDQTFGNWECIVVDDGSTDDSLNVALDCASRDSRIRVTSQANRGQSAARNRGYLLSSSASNYVTFMDADDVWRPHALGTLRQRLVEEPSAIGAHGLAEFIDEQGEPVATGSYAATGRHRVALRRRKLVPLSPLEPTDFSVLINGNVLFPPGLLLARRSVYDRVGPFDESFRGPEDWDMLIRISRFGYLSFVDDVVLWYRRHTANAGASETVPREAWLVRCKGFHSPENSRDQQGLAVRGWRAYQVQMMRQYGRGAIDAARSRNIGKLAADVGRAGLHCYRCARGCPTPRLSRTDPTWDDLRTRILGPSEAQH